MQGGPIAALGKLTWVKRCLVSGGWVGPTLLAAPRLRCGTRAGGPLESRAHLRGLDPSAVPFPPGRVAGRESLRRVFCAPELPPRAPGPRAQIPLLRLEDKPPGAPGCCAPSVSPCRPLTQAGPALPVAVLGPQNLRRDGRETGHARLCSSPRSKAARGGALPTSNGRVSQRPPESAASARAGAGSALRGNHFNRGCSAFSPKECFECSESWNIQTPRGRRPPRHHPGGAAASFPPGWAGGATRRQGLAPWPHGVACPHCRAIRS